MKAVYEIGQKYGIPVHLDGARIFLSCIKLDIDISKITQYCDTLMFCLSKNLLCPIGSILCGS